MGSHILVLNNIIAIESAAIFDVLLHQTYTFGPMPELPEVETVRGAMEHHLLNQPIARVHTSNKRLREPLPRAALHALVGDSFTAARRRAKFLLLDLRSGRTLLVHLGMSGNLLFRPRGEKHDHLAFAFDDGSTLVYNDPRRFGLLLVLDKGEENTCRYLQKLGPEPLSSAFNTRYLTDLCQRRKSPIKILIMDNCAVVGVGNIYASEALFRARIHPATPATAIDPTALAQLVKEIKRVLRAAIRKGGTTISDYRGSGEGGWFQQRLNVYGRQGEDCRVCDAPIESLYLGGRNTFYCPRCQ